MSNKIGYLGFSNEFPDELDERFVWVGYNTGNLIFDYTLKQIIDAELIPMNQIRKFNADDYKTFITTAFIWIQPNEPKLIAWYKSILSYVKDKPLIPISVGLQSPTFSSDFKIHEDTVKILTEMAERCVLGVRGYYSAEILNKHGIKNIKVVGCPSLYLNLDPNSNFSIKNIKNPSKSCSNFRAFHGKLRDHEKNFLKYCADKDFSFVEQNQITLTKNCAPNDYPKLKKWMEDKSKIFFCAEEWIDFMRSFDFNIGYRFHANVAAILAGVPSLFLAIDSRVTEMCEFFKLPTIKPEAFDPQKDLEYYSELADYTQFNSNFSKLIENFKDFCNDNHITLKGK
ncbi:MAG: polysaccharide pyruvyl transferase family protein [Defluviitaleaceae bacterium]|nr:polysaccharide pyruvyl transferase family protein [Defluviitaleaceae bacterium]